jgi:hypothetical protein
MLVLSLYASGNYLYAGMNAGGVWKRPLAEITGITVKRENALTKVYPNPAKNEIIIEPGKSQDQVTITIYTVNGQELIKQTANGCKAEVDVTSLPDGVYIVKTFNEDNMSVNKFVKH